MPSRFRDRDETTPFTGSFYWVPATYIGIGYDGRWQSCYDITGNFPNANSFDLKTFTVVRPRLSGEQYIGGTLVRKLDNYPIDYVPSPVDPESVLGLPDVGDLQNMIWETLASTNVSEPHLGLPTFLAELKDIPSLVRGWGGDLLHKVAKGHLSWRWAARPMISDVQKMLSFVDAVYNRSVELSLLQNQRQTRRKASLGGSSASLVETSKLIHSSTGFFIEADRTVHMSSRAWGSVNWVLDPGVQLPSSKPDELFHIARYLAAGATSRAALSALWEITPWSWFIDWFIGVSDVMAATNNSIPCTWARTCVMVNQRSHAEYDNVVGLPSWAKLSGLPVEVFDRKLRFPVVPLLPFVPSFKPLVSPKAWSILASLAALRGGGTVPRPRGTRL